MKSIPAHITAPPLVEPSIAEILAASQKQNLTYLTVTQIAEIPIGDIIFSTKTTLLTSDEVTLKPVNNSPGWILVAGKQSEDPWLPGFVQPPHHPWSTIG
jgi:hypothetical protein